VQNIRDAKIPTPPDFFILGLIATISIRIVTVLMQLNPVYGKVAWYMGVGFFNFLFI